MTEKEERDLERLKTVDDYFAEFEKISDASNIIRPDILDKMVGLLSTALYKKYKYIIKASASFRRKQSFISLIRDYLNDRQLKKASKKADSENNEPECNSVVTNISPATPTGVPLVSTAQQQLVTIEENPGTSHSERSSEALSE